MSDASERFLDRLTRSFLPNHELATHARSEVEARLKPDQDKALEAAAHRLEAVDASKWKPGWTKWAMLGVVLIVLAVLGLVGMQFTSLNDLMPDFGGPSRDFGRMLAKETMHLSAEERLLLVGDVSKSLGSDRAKALWDQDPANPAYFEDYAIAYVSDRSKLPPDFIETAEKLDPENGWFHLLAAAVVSKDAVKQVSQTKQEKESRQAPKWTILDQSRMDEALSLFEKGCSKARIQSYETELLKRRLALLPEPKDFQGSLLNISYVAFRPTPSVRFFALAKAVSAQAAILADKKDSSSFRSLLGNWLRFTKVQLIASPMNVIEPLISRINLDQPNPNFLQAAKELGMAEEAALLDEVGQVLKKEKAERNARRSGAADELIERHGAVLQGLTAATLLRQVANPPKVTLAHLTPSRRTDHALFARALLLAMTVLLLLLAAALAAYPFRHGELCRKLSRRHFSLLDCRDWAILLSGGVVLPVLYFGVIRYLTPLGGLEWSVRSTLFCLPYGQFSLLLLLVISTSLLLLQSRMGGRLGIYQGLSGVSKVGLKLTGVGYVALPLLGLSTSKPLLMPVLIGGGIVLGLLLIWLLSLVIRGLFGNAHHALERQVVARLLVPVLLFAALLNCVAMPLLHLEESHWVKQDGLFRPDPAKPALSAFEAQVAEQMKAELLEMMSPLEAISR